MPLWLTRKDVQTVLHMPAAIDAVEKAFALLSRGESVMPLRTNMSIIRSDPDQHGSLLAMPAYVGGSLNGLGVKLITLYGNNPSTSNLPAIQGNFVLFDPTDGRLLAVMEAGYMTAVRTGAATGVATRHLARTDARVVTLFGTGAQAPFQLDAVCAERPVEEVLVLSRRPQQAEQFAIDLSERLGISVRATEDREGAVRRADLIITATSATEPLFDGDWVRPGTHISGIGSHVASAREVDTKTVQRAKVVVDQINACLAEAGDLVIPLREGAIDEDQIYAEIGAIVAGERPGRTSDEEITFFKSVGLAVQDVAVATLVVQQAQIHTIGQQLEE